MFLFKNTAQKAAVLDCLAAMICKAIKDPFCCTFSKVESLCLCARCLGLPASVAKCTVPARCVVLMSSFVGVTGARYPCQVHGSSNGAAVVVAP